MYTIPTVPRTFVFLAAADYVFRRVMEDNVSNGNCKLHGLNEAQAKWRACEPHKPGAEIEGMMASWLSETGFRDFDQKDLIYSLLFGADHRWVKTSG